MQLCKMLLVLCLSFFCSTLAFAQCDPGDFAALKALYNSSNGDSWANNTGWNLVRDNAAPPGGCDLSGLHGITISGSRVAEINLDNNSLTGALPAPGLESLTALEVFNVGNSNVAGTPNRNNLSGTIPPGLASLSALRRINLMGNDFSGDIPPGITSLMVLEYLLLSGNNLAGSIPSDIGNLTELLVLWLGYNDLSGTIPTSIGALTKLRDFNAEANSLSGPIPDEIGNCDSLVNLWLRNNTTLSGEIPAGLNNKPLLKTVRLSNNNFSGALPDFSGAPLLEQLGLGQNDFSGALPASYGTLTNLYLLGLGYNNLTGSIPANYSNLVNLQIFNLNDNGITGTFPAGFGNFPAMINFNTSNNPQLGGSLPTAFSNSLNMNNFNIENCNFSGGVPAGFTNWTQCLQFRIGGNTLDGTIPDFFDNMLNLSYVSMNDNNFTGAMPATLAAPDSVAFLFLQNNQLTGCYDAELDKLCTTLVSYNIDTGNSFDANWLDFCGGGSGACITGSDEFCVTSNGLPIQVDAEGNICASGIINAGQAFQLTPMYNEPINPAIGLMYFDGITRKLRVWDGSFWQDCW